MDDSATTLPAAGRPFIKRPRLTRVLDEVQARVIMLVAPAGYGKTTLAHEWLEGRQRPSAWYTCIPASADVAALSVGLAQAAEAVVPGAAERLATRLRVTNAPESEVDVLAEILAEDLAPWPEEAWLCLDDYHFTRRAQAAEHFVERVLALSPLRLLIATRERPSWATPRRILYGELVEIGTSALAMTHDEAGRVLTGGGPKRLPGLLALTEGWPAAIGLAALMPDLEIPEEGLPAPLYDYIAEELYQSASPELRASLCELAIAPRPTLELLNHVFGDAAQQIADDAVRLGFLLRREHGAFDLHPLLRAFLDSKLRELGDERAGHIVDRIGTLLLDRGRWDETFLIASRHRRGDLLVSLVERSYEELLTAGRLPTLVEWLSSPAVPGNSAVADLVRGEIAFRAARYGEAEALARQAAARLPRESLRRANALCVAGRAAYFLDRPDAAIEFFREARAVAATDDLRRLAVRGEVLVAADAERDGVEDLVTELAALTDSGVDNRLLLESARLHAAICSGNLVDAVTQAEASLHLIPRSQDPLIRSSLLSIASMAYLGSARYSEALALIDRGLADAEKFRLDFVWPEVLTLRAQAQWGLRDFAAAFRSLRRLHAEAVGRDDTRCLVNVTAIRLRIRIAQHDFKRGFDESRIRWKRLPSAGAYGPYIACQALALACARQTTESVLLADRAESLTSQAETRVLVALTRTINALISDRGNGAALVQEAAEILTQTGYFDGLVASYRGFPPLLAALYPALGETLLTVIHEARDDAIARAAGLDVRSPPLPGKRIGLSKRETEVFHLVCQGLTNREIARTLFISESTAKVHVRNVLRKLNVRSRTEAVLVAGDEESLR